MNTLEKIKKTLESRESRELFEFATISAKGIRRNPDDKLDAGYRQNFAVDVDRILNSLAYTRYIDKTQVFYLIKNDHITHRVLHVQLVSKVARTIGRFLGLNEDLTEAVSLGHDIGHCPFGHDGEKILSGLCQSGNMGSFHHNVQSVQFLEKVERKGRGWNLCLQTLDGILCHDGEVHNRQLKPDREKTFVTHEKEISERKSNINLSTMLIPMTLEGCVVRMADTISYIGRDIEDAIRLGMIKRSDLPEKCVSVLGSTNGAIVYNLVTDIISNSFQQEFITFSTKVSDALWELKQFNYARIYMHMKIKKNLDAIKKLFDLLFERYIDDLRKENRSSVIFSKFLFNMSEDYIKTHKNEEIVRDFIAGMTDQYFLSQCPEKIRPEFQVLQ